MSITLHDLIVDFSHLDPDALLSDWRWLTGSDKQPILITAMGNAFLLNRADDSVWLLDAGEGSLKPVTNSVEELEACLSDHDFVMERFLVEDFVGLREAGKRLAEGQVYGYIRPPALGGGFDIENLEPTDMQVHFSFSGQVHEQVKDLPEGTPISNISFGKA
ncbi:DUF1851 domain-containing protein [Gallaecimonas kandeliae]|uniref:T6SS immunity protein Tdi1 domain-containing protein n=1 Tax=Gallaecimonas kandeliae TaxID=3029055 RepID=UPI002648D7F0|nr:T6SS immunity protein Tdi1 domain-containing protein [Gallaecimonas kandeliae]WKE67149.1 DUF1851 domain-containing protein [Gallaecimonas kandeliae]